MQLLGDGVGFAQHDAHFHQTVVRLTDNETLTVLIEMLYHIIAAHNQRFLAQSRTDSTGIAAGPSSAPTRNCEACSRRATGMAPKGSGVAISNQVAKYMITDPATTVVEVLA